MTKQRQAILDCFKENVHPLAIEEILQKASRVVPQLNLTTVYRNLKTLMEQGFLTAVDLPGSATRYERVGLDHHHHFLCEMCNRLFDIEGCPKGIASLVPEGFKLTSHIITLTGCCADCQP